MNNDFKFTRFYIRLSIAITFFVITFNSHSINGQIRPPIEAFDETANGAANRFLKFIETFKETEPNTAFTVEQLTKINEMFKLTANQLNPDKKKLYIELVMRKYNSYGHDKANALLQLAQTFPKWSTENSGNFFLSYLRGIEGSKAPLTTRVTVDGKITGITIGSKNTIDYSLVSVQIKEYIKNPSVTPANREILYRELISGNYFKTGDFTEVCKDILKSGYTKPSTELQEMMLTKLHDLILIEPKTDIKQAASLMNQLWPNLTPEVRNKYLNDKLTGVFINKLLPFIEKEQNNFLVNALNSAPKGPFGQEGIADKVFKEFGGSKKIERLNQSGSLNNFRLMLTPENKIEYDKGTTVIVCTPPSKLILEANRSLLAPLIR